MIKKCFFFLFIVASFLFLSPLNVKAEEGYRPTLFNWKDNNSTDLQTYSNYYSHRDISRPSQDMWYDFNIRYSSSLSNFSDFDYYIFSVGLWKGTTTISSDENYQGWDYTLTKYTENNLTLSAMFNGGNILQPCYILGKDSGQYEMVTYFCPIPFNVTSFDYLKVSVYYDFNILSDDIEFLINRWATGHFKGSSASSITGAINNQTTDITNSIDNTTDAINDVNNSLNDSSTTDANNSANSFFSNFNVSSMSGLTTLATAPLTLVNSITDTCQPITLPFNFDLLNASTGGSVPDKNVILPCGTTLFWENSNFGSKLTNFRSFWNILIGGPIIYGLMTLVMKHINKALDPMNDELVFLNVSNNSKSKDEEEGDSND